MTTKFLGAAAGVLLFLAVVFYSPALALLIVEGIR